MVSSVVQAMELGRQAARQREEDAYQKARRPIENAFSDQLSGLQIEGARQGIDIRGAAEKRAQGEYDKTQEDAARDDLYKAGSLFNEAIARQIDANPGMKPSDIIKNAPPEVLKRVKLDTPEAQAHFAEIYDADPSQLRTHAQMFGGAGRKISKQEAAKDESGKEGFLLTFEDGQTQFVPGYSKVAANPYPGAYTTPDGIRHAADGSIISMPDVGTMQAIAAAKGEGGEFGKASGKNQAEDLPWSQSDANKAADVIGSKAVRDASVKGAIDRAIGLVSPMSAGTAAISKAVGGTPAADLAAELSTIGSIIGLDELQRLRDNSKTGGALGQVTEAEHKLLQSVIASIDQNQSPDKLKANLERVKKTAAESWDRVQAAYERDLKQFGPGAAAPAAGKKLKYNPATGELE